MCLIKSSHPDWTERTEGQQFSSRRAAFMRTQAWLSSLRSSCKVLARHFSSTTFNVFMAATAVASWGSDIRTFRNTAATSSTPDENITSTTKTKSQTRMEWTKVQFIFSKNTLKKIWGLTHIRRSFRHSVTLIKSQTRIRRIRREFVACPLFFLKSNFQPIYYRWCCFQCFDTFSRWLSKQ